MHQDCRKASREKEMKYEVRMLCYVHGAKRTLRGGNVKLPFFLGCSVPASRPLEQLPGNFRLFGFMYYLAMDSRGQ